MSKAAGESCIAFKAIHEVRWLSRYFAINALVRNYNALLKYCEEQAESSRDPIAKYCFKKLISAYILTQVG